MTDYKPRAADHKKDKVQKLLEYFNKYDIVGIANLENLPAAQLQKIRGNLRENAEVYMTKKRLIKIAVDQLKDQKPGLQNIKEQLKGMPALVFTHENPFSLFKTLKKSKSPAPAKEGQEAPKEIVIPAGPTPFAPGPVISELAQLGIKSKVENGKITIVKDTPVIKEGEKFSAGLASMLTRLSILPMEIGLNISSIYEKGTIYTKNVLDVDEDKYVNDIMTAATESFNLSVEAGYIIKDNVEVMLQKAFREVKALTKESGFLTSENVGDMLGQAEAQMKGLAAQAKINVQEGKKAAAETKTDEKKEETKSEQKTPEEKKEKTEEAKIEEKPKDAQEVVNKAEGMTKADKKEKEDKKKMEEVAKLAEDLQKKGTLRD